MPITRNPANTPELGKMSANGRTNDISTGNGPAGLQEQKRGSRRESHRPNVRECPYLSGFVGLAHKVLEASDFVGKDAHLSGKTSQNAVFTRFHR